jgi:superoxide dismutase, Fe-Mn family
MRNTKKFAAASIACLLGWAASAWAEPAAGPVVFEPLPYPADALEPYIDAQTMDIHYNRHHRAYYNNFMKAVEGTDMAGQPLEALFARMGELPAVVRNNGGGHWNHDLFWKVMSPDGGGLPEGELAAAIDAAFGSFDEFKKTFGQAAATRFGSGWAWLCVDADGSLFVTSTPNQDNPLMDVADRRGRPILGLDVWEHAYYLKYQNLRGSYVEAFWNVVNWPEVAARFAAARASAD